MSSSHSFRRGSCSSTQPRAPLNPRRARYVDGTVDDCYLAEVEDNLSPYSSDSKPRSAVNHPSTSTHTPPSPPQSRPPKRSKQSKRTSSPKDESKSPFPAVDVDYSEYALGVEPCSDPDEREDENDGNASYYSHSESESCGPPTPNSDAEPNHYPHNYAYAHAPYSSPYLHPYYHWNHAAFQPHASYPANYDTNLNAGSYCHGPAGQWGNLATNMIAQLCGNMSSSVLSSDSGMTHGNTFSNIGNNNSRVIFKDEETRKMKKGTRKGTKTDPWL